MDIQQRTYEQAILGSNKKIEVPYAFAYEVDKGLPTICLFGLKPETPRHPHFIDFMWPIAKQLSYDLFPDIPRNQFSWLIGHKYEASEVRFDEIQGQIYGLEFSNEYILTASKFGSVETFQELEDQMSKRTFADIRKLAYEYDEPGAPPTTPAHPGLVWAVETEHSPTGIVFLEPEFQDSIADSDHEFMLVDSQKLLEKIYSNDPEMFGHAKRKFRGESVASWFSHHCSPDQKIPMPSFELYDRPDGDVDMRMITGHAGILEVIRLAELPFVPIAVRSREQDDLLELMSLRVPGFELPEGYGKSQAPLINKLRQSIGIGPHVVVMPRSHELGLPPTPRFEIV